MDSPGERKAVLAHPVPAAPDDHCRIGLTLLAVPFCEVQNRFAPDDRVITEELMTRLVLSTVCIVAVALIVTLTPGVSLADSADPGSLSTPERDVQSQATRRSTVTASPAA